MINVVKNKERDIASKAYAEATLLISVLELGYSLEEDKNLLKKNDGSLYDYLKFAEDETYREKLRGLFDLYYRYRFRGDEVTEEKLKGVM